METFDISSLKIPACHFVKNEDRMIYVRKPDQLIIPNQSLDLINLPTGLVRLSDNQILKYLSDILTDEMRIKRINGVEDNMECLCCDYCSTLIDISSEHYFYCIECNQDMCVQCEEETTEEIAKAHGAKMWFLRAQSLEECRAHGLIKRTGKISCIEDRYCDECNKTIMNTEDRYANDEDQDLCMNCSVTCKNLITEWNLNFIPASQIDADELSANIEEYNMFGSMIDWIPIYKDNDDDMILLCCNPLNKFYNRCALTCYDDHGRSGFYTCKSTDTIQNLVNEFSGSKLIVNTEVSKESNESEESEDSYIKGIKKLMENRLMPTHYG
jgi:hypothetical protein